jgi:signal transduction histidine kinase
MEKTFNVKETASAKKQVAMAVVHTAAAGLGAALKNYKDDTERTKFIRGYVHAIRFFADQSGYFFVYKLDGLNIALPNPKEWEGRDLKDYQDSHGTYVIREAAAAAKKGGGFIQYYWTKPGTKTELKKIAYIEAIPGTKYLIGTGYYEE